TQNPSHTYVSAGIFTATLTVTDAVGGKVQANVGPISVSGPLSARAGAAPTAGDAPVTAAFFGSASGGTLPYSFTWSLGDGTTSISQNPDHSYGVPGTFTVSLMVTDANGSVVPVAPLTVNVAAGPLVASAAAATSSGDAPMAAALSGSLTGGTPPYTFAWNLGDGTTSSQSSVNHTYTSAGNYSARLTVTDGHGV